MYPEATALAHTFTPQGFVFWLYSLRNSWPLKGMICSSSDWNTSDCWIEGFLKYIKVRDLSAPKMEKWCQQMSLDVNWSGIFITLIFISHRAYWLTAGETDDSCSKWFMHHPEEVPWNALKVFYTIVWEINITVMKNPLLRHIEELLLIPLCHIRGSKISYCEYTRIPRPPCSSEIL